MLLVSSPMRMSRVYATPAMTIMSARMMAKLATIRRRIVRFITMKNLTIRRRIVASFAIILALMMVMAGVAYTRLIRIGELTRSIELDTLPGLDYSHLIVVDRIANYS